ncbi:outer membrane beta-barrel protein [Sphingomonas sp. MMS24-JH45]
MVSTSDFRDAEAPDGAPLPQQFRNFTLYSGSGEVGYALRGGAVAAYRRRSRRDGSRFRRHRSTSSSNVVEVLAGLNSEITPLLRGRIGIGYLHADFADPSVRSRGGLGSTSGSTIS